MQAIHIKSNVMLWDTRCRHRIRCLGHLNFTPTTPGLVQRFVQADVDHQRAAHWVHHFKTALRSPLRDQLHTRGPTTFAQAVVIAEELDRGLWAKLEKAPQPTPRLTPRPAARVPNYVRTVEAESTGMTGDETPVDEIDTAPLPNRP